MTFRTIDLPEHRSGARPTVLLPGWATDSRVFGALGAGGPRVVCDGPPTDATANLLAAYLREMNHGPVAVVGWSLGGVAAIDFAHRHPDLLERLVLIGLRPRYPEGEIAAVHRELRADPRRFLSQFYRRCYLPPQRQDYRRFRDTLEEAYLNEMDAAVLDESLDYLARTEIKPTGAVRKALVLHGAHDSVAPLSEISSLLAGSVSVLPNSGHAAFASEEGQARIADFLQQSVQDWKRQGKA